MSNLRYCFWIGLTCILCPGLPAAFPLTAHASEKPSGSELAQGPLGLKLRRSEDAIDLVVVGTGPSPQIRQSRQGNAWNAVLTTSSPRGVFVNSRRFSLPEAGIESVTIDGGGSRFQLDVKPLAGLPLGMPKVSSDGKDLILSFPISSQVLTQIARPNIKAPGTLPRPSFVPELKPRAVAPPLGDMAVGSMVLRNQSYLDVSGPTVTLTLRNAPAKDALMAIAQIGGYGFVFVDDQSSGSSSRAVSSPSSNQSSEDRTVTISFREESYAKALNSVLLASGLQGKREGKLILAGKNVLGKSFGPQISKIYRLNQASAASAADYLASLGAAISKVNVLTATSSSSDTAGTASSSVSQTSAATEKFSTVETYGASSGPLQGLSGTTDSRLQTITLFGDGALVAVAENYLRQIDLRQRQVALNVKILDVTLSNDFVVDNSFAFRYGNNLVVSNSGEVMASFNGLGVPNADPAQDLEPGAYESYPKNVFYDYLKARIESGSTKVIASPTLILSENPEAISGGQEVATGASEALNTASIGRPRANEAFVTVGTEVVTSFNVQAGQNGAPNTCEPEFGTSGLTFGARVNKIDDNGFVTFTMSPSVSAETDSQLIPNCGPVSILSVRRLDTGSVRVRDGQTLVLTGVISDSVQQAVTKWPLLGDIPFIGQFFRQSANSRDKRELVILVTPRVLNDYEGGVYGYGSQQVSVETRSSLSSMLTK